MTIKPKRYVPIKKFCEISGLSYATANHMMNSGQLAYITTESGLRRIDTQHSGQSDEAVVICRLQGIERQLNALCRQFNVATGQ